MIDEIYAIIDMVSFIKSFENRLKTAFPEQPIPQRDIIFDDAVKDDPDIISFYNRILRGQSWYEIVESSHDIPTVNELSEHKLSFSPVGYRYYLPAYLLIVVKYYDEVDCFVESVIHRFNPKRKKSKAVRTRIDIQDNSLSAAHYDAINDFLIFIENYHSSEFENPFMPNPLKEARDYVSSKIRQNQ
ncbi:MAG: DUF6714 family protein [bacterium]